jgi:hypothetical protein
MKAVRIVDRRQEGERRDRANSQYGHEPAAGRIRSDRFQHHLVEDGASLTKHSARDKHWAD